MSSLDRFIESFNRYRTYKEGLVATLDSPTKTIGKAKNVSFNDLPGAQIPSQTKEVALLSRLLQDREKKIAEARALDLEIQKLDEDITFLERHPEADEILRRISGRFTSGQ